MQDRKVVSREEWHVARKEHLVKEKAFTRLRRELPRVKVDKEYIFDGPDSKESLADLFCGRSQMTCRLVWRGFTVAISMANEAGAGPHAHTMS